MTVGQRTCAPGQSLVEFAIIGPLLIILLLGTVDFARAFHAQMVIRQAVAEGAYYIAQHPGATDEAEERVRLELADLEDPAGRATVDFDTTSCSDGRQDTTVEVRYRHSYWFSSVLPAPEATLRSSSTVPQFGSCQ
jgi:Flp pilus assembly protein TadG